MDRPKREDFKFPSYETELDQYVEYAYELNDYCDYLEKKINHMYFMIGEALVENSKLHITDEQCLKEIRRQLQEFKR